jgi:hypothetical protein
MPPLLDREEICDGEVELLDVGEHLSDLTHEKEPHGFP